MLVSELMTPTCACCHADDPLTRATYLMWEEDCGCVPVVDREETLCGIVTDRDAAMAAYTSGERLSSIPVSRAMSQDVKTCRASDSIEDVLAILGEAQVHRLPVVDERSRVVGLLSLADVLEGLQGQRGKVRSRLADAFLATLAEVKRPRTAAPPPNAGAPAPSDTIPRPLEITG